MNIFDRTLSPIKQIRAQYGIANLDQHETMISPDGTAAFVISYNPEVYDLSAQDITTGQGWIQNSIFQRIDVDTGDLTFSWSPIEHVDLSEGFVLPNSTEVVGSGLSPESPWDYFHLNSIEENPEDGHYMLSARHVNTVFKIDGETGEIIWRLGGSLSDFEFEEGLNFSSQHDARFMSSNASAEIISLFDNASNGFQRTADRSTGMILLLDHNANPPSVRLLKSFPSPDDAPLSNSQGNMQVLNRDDWDNSHVFIGWGNNPYITEHDASGRIIFQANVEASDGNTSPMNYRAYKFNFTSDPIDAPALYTYARTDDSNTVYSMSWNGATEVRRWRIYGKSDCDDDWSLIDVVDKSGFETMYRADGFQEYGLVEAVDGEGRGLRNSSAKGSRTFVPSSFMVGSCDQDGCREADEYVAAEDDVDVAQSREACPVAAGPQIGLTSSGSGTGSASGSGQGDAGDENIASRLAWRFGLTEAWMLTVLLLATWSALV
jgi:hypothetical protein